MNIKKKKKKKGFLHQMDIQKEQLEKKKSDKLPFTVTYNITI